MTALEAWVLVKQEGWTADAQPGNRFECKGALTEDGYCNEWHGLMGSASQDSVASFQVKKDKSVVIQAGVHAPEVLDNAFSLKDVLDSSDVAPIAWQWMQVQGLKIDETRLSNLGLNAASNALSECGQADTEPAEAYYLISFFRPDGRLCLNPNTGTVTYSTYAD